MPFNTSIRFEDSIQFIQEWDIKKIFSLVLIVQRLKNLLQDATPFDSNAHLHAAIYI